MCKEAFEEFCKTANNTTENCVECSFYERIFLGVNICEIVFNQDARVRKLEEENLNYRNGYKKIEIMRQLKKANEVIDFYGDKTNWRGIGQDVDHPYLPMIIVRDIEVNHGGKYYDEQCNVGGKKAREYRNKYPKE